MTISVIILLSGCAGKDPDAFTVPVDYRTWGKPVDKILNYPVPGHGATYRIIYGNKAAFLSKVTKDQRGDEMIVMPDGSIIIKEVYKTRRDVGRTEPVLDIMVKVSTNRAARNGWLYFVKNPGKPLVRVEGRLCIGCHESANEPHPYFDKNKKGIFRDYLFVKFAKGEPNAD